MAAASAIKKNFGVARIIRMLEIIICDDERFTCSKLENMILEYAESRSIKFNVEIFYSGDTLVKYLEVGSRLDILFLDIELPGLDGIDVGSFIRKDIGNEQMFIVYISSNEQYAMRLFENRPFDFLIKPLEKQDIFKVLDNITGIISRENLFFEYQSGKNMFSIPYKEIIYFQSTGKRIDIVMADGRKGFYDKLSNIIEYLPGNLFLSIHKSHLINMNYVKEYTYEKVTMTNDHILNISKINRAAVRKRVLEREHDIRNC